MHPYVFIPLWTSITTAGNFTQSSVLKKENCSLEKSKEKHTFSSSKTLCPVAKTDVLVYCSPPASGSLYCSSNRDARCSICSACETPQTLEAIHNTDGILNLMFDKHVFPWGRIALLWPWWKQSQSLHLLLICSQCRQHFWCDSRHFHTCTHLTKENSDTSLPFSSGLVHTDLLWTNQEA